MSADHSANHLTDNEARRRAGSRLSPAVKWALGSATLLTLALAGLSAWAVHSEPTMRAEDSSYESRSKALAVRRSLAASRDVAPLATTEASSFRAPLGTRADVTPGATHTDEYLPRAHALDRSL